MRHTFTPMREGDDEESGACEPEAAPPAVETFEPPLRLYSAYEPPPAYTTLTDTFRGRLGRTEPRSEPPRDLAVGVGCLDHILLTRHWRCLATLDMIDEAPHRPPRPPTSSRAGDTRVEEESETAQSRFLSPRRLPSSPRSRCRRRASLRTTCPSSPSSHSEERMPVSERRMRTTSGAIGRTSPTTQPKTTGLGTSVQPERHCLSRSRLYVDASARFYYRFCRSALRAL